MGAIMNVMKKLARGSMEKEELPDDETRDKYLRSLRRERRVQMEEVEKEQLKKKIAAYKQARARKHLWGVKQAKVQRARKYKVHRNMLKNNSTWVGRGNV